MFLHFRLGLKNPTRKNIENNFSLAEKHSNVFSDFHPGTETAVCLMFMSRRRVRAKFDTFSDLQRQKLGSIMRSYRICLHNTAQF